MLSDLPPGVEPYMIPGNGPDDGVVSVAVHSGGHPAERMECVVELGTTGEWLVATWVPEADRWRFPYQAPISEAREHEVVMWADLREIFAA